MSDAGADIDQQAIEQRQVTEPPRPFDGPVDATHRYEGLLVGPDLDAAFRKFETETLALARLRHDAPAVGDDLDCELRSLGTPQTAAVYQLWNQGHVIAPLSTTAVPLELGTRDLPTILSYWRPAGPYVDNWPGVPCRPGTFYALNIWDASGAAWWREVSIQTWPAKQRERPPMDRLEELGVPGEPDVWEDDYRQKPPQQRAIMAGVLRLVEHRPAQAVAQRVVGEAWTGSIRGAAAQRAMKAARGTLLRTLNYRTWSWPEDLALPTGRLRDGVETVAALPAENSILTIDGIELRCQQTPPLSSPPPPWLVDALNRL